MVNTFVCAVSGRLASFLVALSLIGSGVIAAQLLGVFVEPASAQSTQALLSCTWQVADEDHVSTTTPINHTAHGHNWLRHCSDSISGWDKHFVRPEQITEVHGASQNYCLGHYGTFRRDGNLIDSTNQSQCWVDLLFWHPSSYQIWPWQSHGQMTSYAEHNWVWGSWDELLYTEAIDSSV